MLIHWSGCGDGLGNRIFGLTASLAYSRLAGAQLAFKWPNNHQCPCDYNDILQPIEGLFPNRPRRTCDLHISCPSWDPIKIYQAFQAQLGKGVAFKDYLELCIELIRSLPYHTNIFQSYQQWMSGVDKTGHISIHLRRTDKIQLHKKSFRDLLMFRNVKAGLYIAREVGFGQAIEYFLLPTKWIEHRENQKLGKAICTLITSSPNLSYSLYCDSPGYIDAIQESFRKNDIPATRYIPSHCEQHDRFNNSDSNIRKTSMQDAMVEMLCMTHASAILQNSPASTFSLAASIIGSVPIISRTPNHPFWLAVISELGSQPYNIQAKNNYI